MPAVRRKRNFRRKPYRKKKTAPKNSRQLAHLRAPITETKAYAQKNNDNDDSGAEQILLDPAKPGQAIICPVHYGMKQGLRDWEFSGDEITQKYLTQKLSFQFPVGEEAIRKPYRIQLIHGFITRPAGFTQFEDPVASEISREQLSNRLTNLVTRPWNETEDYMDFRVKQKTFYKIIGKQWIKPNKTNNIAMLPQPHWPASSTGEEIQGAIPDVNVQLSWPVFGKKMRLTYSDDSESDDTPDPFWYNNEAYFPFTVIYTPDPANIQGGLYAEDDQKVKVLYNTKMWYSDN